MLNRDLKVVSLSQQYCIAFLWSNTTSLSLSAISVDKNFKTITQKLQLQ